ncbi:unnamed protein product [Spirodela intermedia]|uniref:Endoglucanase n=1 Tax=Spirodela intermedia TaxID=51605 RepID=A0A7I8IHQ1_SPIIN|nr:unnamed protein product [Spirodela intermedia]CAA6656382.1 unnamed protein product [Spirodela intermedia]
MALLSTLPSLACLLLLAMALRPSSGGGSHDYGEALSKSILFFEGQRSGQLPADQRLKWRGDSGLSDGAEAGFGFPMAFTATMLAWSVVEFGGIMPPEDLRHSLTALRWATDYLLKTIAHPTGCTSRIDSELGSILLQVGDPLKDHNCWERPEDMDTPRTVYSVTPDRPGSEVAGETAAALAAASMAFREADATYAERLLRGATTAFEFADSYKGAYSDDTGLKAGVCPFYCDFDGYQDELLWSAAWLRRASANVSFLSYIQNNGKTLGADDNINEFGWDNKHAGINVLISKEFLEGEVLWLQSYKQSADSFMCTLFTPGGLIYKPGGSNMQHVTSIAFLLLVYATTSPSPPAPSTAAASPSIPPPSAASPSNRCSSSDFFQRSWRWLLLPPSPQLPAEDPPPGSSLPAKADRPEQIGCKEGSPYFNSQGPNPNILVGAVVGGPGEDDAYGDDRPDFRKSEPTTYINAPLVGVLAYFAANPS